jgi:transposase InsO family protein
MALWKRKHPKGVIVHSDRGSQYCSQAERVKQIETSLLKNKTTNGLFWQPIM